MYDTAHSGAISGVIAWAAGGRGGGHAKTIEPRNNVMGRRASKGKLFSSFTRYASQRGGRWPHAPTADPPASFTYVTITWDLT